MKRLGRPQLYRIFVLNDVLRAIIRLKKTKKHTKTFYKRYLILRRKFYQSPEWRKLSKLVKQHSGFRCRICGNGNTRIDVHHINPIYYFPELALCIANLICLCRNCHRSIHKEAAAA